MRWNQSTGVLGQRVIMTTKKKPSEVIEPSNRVKDRRRVTGAQVSYLKTLCEEAGEEFDPHHTKAEASRRIDELQAKTGRGRDH